MAVRVPVLSDLGDLLARPATPAEDARIAAVKARMVKIQRRKMAAATAWQMARAELEQHETMAADLDDADLILTWAVLAARYRGIVEVLAANMARVQSRAEAEDALCRNQLAALGHGTGA